MVVALRPETGDVGHSGLRAVFSSLNEEHQTNIVRWALANRPRVSEQARVALNNALIGNVSVRGFQGSGVADAPAIMLIQPVCNAANLVDSLAEAVLTVWKESRAELREIVEDATGNTSLANEHGETIAAALASANPQYSSADVNLMIALLTGEHEQTPADPPTDAQQMLDDFLADLRALPADRPEWDGPITQLMSDIAELKASKTRENEEANGVGSRIREVMSAHADILSFFEWNPEERLPNTSQIRANEESVSGIIEELSALLERYGARRAMGATYADEMRRVAERAELNEQIMAALKRLEDIAALPEQPSVIEEVVPAVVVPADDEMEPSAVAEAAEDLERQYLREMLGALQRENTELKAAAKAARKKDSRAKAAAEEKEAVKTETDDSEPSQEQHEPSATAEVAQPAVIIEPRVVEPQTEDEMLAPPPDFGDVASVLDFVENRWPGQLKIAFNKSSDRKLYFDKPNQVYSALEWLATTYRQSRTGEKPLGNLDVSLFTTCGWRYRPSQPEAMGSRQRADYQTTDDGTHYTLDEHIGRGTGRTPGQIRLAFAWDDERKMVILGYIGRHRRADK